MKIGFAKRRDGAPKEDRTRSQDRSSKQLLGGLAVIAALLAGIAAAGIKLVHKFKKEDR